jgi:hypothetical protein
MDDRSGHDKEESDSLQRAFLERWIQLEVQLLKLVVKGKLR